jgi:phage tail sheath protein FI
LISKNELERGPDSPSAGLNGISHTAVGLSQVPFTEGAGGQREDLNNNGVNVIMKRPSQLIEVFGWRTVVNAVTDPNWINFGNARLYMAIAADADQIAESFVFRVIDGKGQTMGEFNGALTGMLLSYYQQGGLYGLSPDQAFNVDTGSQVNTPQTLANNELHAVMNVRMSPFAEFVVIEIVKTPITLEVI